MAILAPTRAQQLPQHAFPYHHEDPLRDDTIKLTFLYPKPQLPPLRDSRKAQRMLGLVTEFPKPTSASFEVSRPSRARVETQRAPAREPERSRDGERTAWMAGRLAAEERDSEASVEEKLRQAERDVRALVGMDMDEEEAAEAEAPRRVETEQRKEAGNEDDDYDVEEGQHLQQSSPQSTTRGWISIGLEQALQQPKEPPPPLKIHVHTPLTHSPLQLSPPSPVELDADATKQSSLAPARIRRARPISSASTQFPNRPTNKIASSRSRGLRVNSCPNYSRPLSGIAPKPVPGEDIERDPLHVRYQAEPPTPVENAKGASAFEGIVAARAQVEEQLKRKKQRPKKARWSSLPISMINFAKRRSSKTDDDHLLIQQATEGKGKRKSTADLTEENLQRWEDEVGYVPKMYRLGYDLLKSPVEMDLEVERATTPDLRGLAVRLPGLPKIGCLTMTPPHTPPMAQQGFVGSSSSAVAREQPKQQSAAAQKELGNERRAILVTCSICKETEHPSTFPARPITSACAHPTRTCKDCIQVWIETCVESRGWDRCTCPECGQAMAFEDVKALASAAGFTRYEELATRAALSRIEGFYWCQSPTCTSGQIQSGSIEENPVFTCTDCGHVHCIKHPTTPYHAGLTCAEFENVLTKPKPTSSAPAPSPTPSLALQHRHVEERQGQKTVQESSRRCSNGLCGWWIQKNEGCDHMTCLKCGFQFCWECGVRWDLVLRKGGKGHRNGCIHWG